MNNQQDTNSRVSRDFSTFTVSISRNEVSKKKLSNSFSLTVPSDRSTLTVKMTLREVKALQNFLNQHLKD
jgi:hypothetical protein